MPFRAVAMTGLPQAKAFQQHPRKRLCAHLRMDQAVQRVHGRRHILAIGREPDFACQPKAGNVCFQNLFHVAAAYDELVDWRDSGIVNQCSGEVTCRGEGWPPIAEPRLLTA